jgi:hypothetical protein
MRVAFAPLTALVTVAALALAPACGFPTQSYEDDGGTSSGGTSDATSHADGGDTGADGTSSADGEPGGDAVSDAISDVIASGDSPTDAASQDSAAMPDAGCASGNHCDCDNDTYMAMSCGGSDCCDNDANAHPGQTSFYPSPDRCLSYDYNCDTMLETEWGAFACSPGVTGCTPTSGFVGGVPGCGVSEQWTGTCKNMITSCQPGTTISQTQACH